MPPWEMFEFVWRPHTESDSVEFLVWAPGAKQARRVAFFVVSRALAGKP